jgi:outer membrane protein TolC
MKHAATLEQEYQAKSREVTARVKIAYFQRFLIQKSMDLSVEHQALLTEFIRIVNKKYAVGQASQQEALHAQVELSKLHNRLLILKQEMEVNTAEINTLINRPLEWPLGPTPALEYRPFSLTFEELTRRAVSGRPELKAAALMIEKSHQARLLIDKNDLPDFMIEIMHWDVHGGANKWQANFKMNLPWIFTQKYDAGRKQAEAEEAQARAERLALHNQTLFELKDLFTRMKTTEQLILVYQGGVLPQAEQSLKAARIGYQSGKINFLSLIESERALRDLQLEYYTALTQFQQSMAQLERMTGSDNKRSER